MQGGWKVFNIKIQERGKKKKDEGRGRQLDLVDLKKTRLYMVVHVQFTMWLTMGW